MTRRLQELAARRHALQQQAQAQRDSLRGQAGALDRRLQPVRRAWRWAGTALLAWKLWQRWRHRGG
jgi:hypothetical protein